MTTENDLAALLRRQDGVLSRDQALECGLTPAAIKHRLAHGLWTLLWPCVYLSAAHGLGPRVRIRAASLWLGRGATLIGAGAAWWLRLLDEPPAVLRFAVPRERRVRSRPDVRVVRRVLTGRRSTVDGVPVLSRADAVVDAAAELGLRRGAELMDRALLSGRVTLEGLQRAHRAHRLLRDAGVTGWFADHRVLLPGYGVAVLDLAFPASRVLVEIDGWAYHRDLPAFRRDHARQNALVLAGWTVLRVDWHALEAEADAVLALIRTAVAS